MKFISGGYYIVAPSIRQEFMDNDIVPDSIISVSECICDIHPVINVFGEVQRKIN